MIAYPTKTIQLVILNLPRERKDQASFFFLEDAADEVPAKDVDFQNLLFPIRIELAKFEPCNSKCRVIMTDFFSSVYWYRA